MGGAEWGLLGLIRAWTEGLIKDCAHVEGGGKYRTE